MRNAMIVVTLGLFLANVRANEADEVKVVLDRAIQAHGGEAALTKFPVIVIKQQGTMSAPGAKDTKYSGMTAFQIPDRFRFEQATEVDPTSPAAKSISGKTIPLVQVLDGDRGWVKLFANTQPMRKKQLEEARESLHFLNVSIRLLPLREKGITLTLATDDKDEGLTALRVSRAERRDIVLLFDKKTGLLAKARYQSRGPLAYGDGAVPTIEETFSEYGQSQGVKVPKKKAIVRREGTQEFKGTDTMEFQFKESPAKEWFVEP